MNITKYKISDTQYLKINPDEFIHENECQFCAEMDIDYIDEKNNMDIRFGYEFADEWYAFLVESKRIQKLLKGEMILDENITHDVGFEYNQIWQKGQKATNILKNHWISNSPKQIHPYYNSWLYNDKQGNIIFEITPFYPWFYKTKKTNPDKISYKQWIKDYKPVVKTIIPKENLKQWIKQADEFGKKYKVKFQ